MPLEQYRDLIIFIGQIGWAASGVVLILKLPQVIKDWIIAKAEREREICEALKQLRPNGGTSLADKISAIEKKLDQHLLEAEADRQKLDLHINKEI